MKLYITYPERLTELEYQVPDETTIRQALDSAWRDWNCVDGTELCVQHNVRSMAVGDILRLGASNPRYFIVDGEGFVDDGQINMPMRSCAIRGLRSTPRTARLTEASPRIGARCHSWNATWGHHGALSTGSC